MKPIHALCFAALFLFAPAALGEEPKSSAGEKPLDAAPSARNQRIILGTPAKQGAYPFQVLLNARKDDGHTYMCGGTLIADGSWVLTAAHCVTDKDGGVMAPWRVSAFVGSVNYGDGNVILAKEVHRHPAYDTVSIDNDVALVRIRARPRGVEFDVIALADPAEETVLGKPDRPMTIIGWGKMETGKTAVRLLEAQTRLKDRTVCNRNYVRYYLQRFEQYLTELPNSPRNTQYEESIFRTLRLDDAARRQVSELIGKQAAAPKIVEVAAKAGNPITERMICAGEQTPAPGNTLVADTCQGDSGGPLFASAPDGQPVQLGIVSFGSGDCGSVTTSGVYARVASFTQWVNGITGRGNSPDFAPRPGAGRSR